MAGISRFEELEAWKGARQLTNLIYELSNQTGFSRDFGLRDQIRRAFISVMSNIAEGFESRTHIQFINFLGVAKASAGEVCAQLYVAFDQKYITETQFKEGFALAEVCARQLAKFILYLEANPRKRRISEDNVDYNIDL